MFLMQWEHCVRFLKNFYGMSLRKKKASCSAPPPKKTPTTKPYLKTSFSSFTLLSGYLLVFVSSKKALAYANGPALTWKDQELQNEVSFPTYGLSNNRYYTCLSDLLFSGEHNDLKKSWTC